MKASKDTLLRGMASVVLFGLVVSWFVYGFGSDPEGTRLEAALFLALGAAVFFLPKTKKP